MPRMNQDGKDVKLVLEWLCRRHFADAELAAALDMPPTNYSRRKDADDFPTFEELGRFAEYFGLCKRALQISFGHLDRDAVALLDDAGMRQYVEQGGGEPPFFPARARRGAACPTIMEPKTPPGKVRRRRRSDAPAGP